MAATSARTDIFRPSAPDFDPEQFTCLGVFDLHPEDGTPAGVRGATVRQAIDGGAHFAGQYNRGQCTHCGAYIRYEALMLHEPTMQLITVGEQCLENRFDWATKEDFAALRAEARRKAEETRERNRRHEIAQAALSWLDSATRHDEVLAELSYLGNGGAVDQSEFLTSIARNLLRYGNLTGRQAAAAILAIVRDAQRRGREEAREAEEAARKATAQPAPTGRVIVEGTVGPTWQTASDYAFSGYVEKFRVHTDDGYDVVATIPAALLAEVDGHAELRGRKVRFAITLKPMADDPTAAWGSRPAKAELLAV